MKRYLRTIMRVGVIVFTLLFLFSIIGRSAVAAEPSQQGQQPPAPQLCDPANPQLTPLAEASVEQIDDLTTQVTYTNALDQSFTLLVRAIDSETMQTFLKEAQLCMEAAPVNDSSFPTNSMGITVPFGDTFETSVQTALDEKGVKLADLIALRNKLSEEAAASETDGPTLRYLFEQFGLDASAADTVAASASDEAAKLIDDAVSNQELDPSLAEDLKGQVKEMYTSSLDEPNAAIIPNDESNVPPSLSIDISLTSTGSVKSETGSYIIYSIFDPTISGVHTNTWTIRSAQWLYVIVTVRGGRISADLYNGTKHVIYLGIKTYNPARNADNTIPGVGDWRRTWWFANKLLVSGWQASNTYDCSCNPLVKQP